MGDAEMVPFRLSGRLPGMYESVKIRTVGWQ